MLDHKGFDEWAGNYDETIDGWSQGYPFEGYYDVLSYVQGAISVPEKKKILDLGIGTGLLTYELYQAGSKITGIDFSEKMLEKARDRMPEAEFFLDDFSSGIPVALISKKFDYIISAYAIHHLGEKEKIDLVRGLKEHLSDGGKMLIADISFLTRAQLERCRKQTADGWDEEEVYFAADEMINALGEIQIQNRYQQVSSCAGVLEIFSDIPR